MNNEIMFPYDGVHESEWAYVTEKLVQEFPIPMKLLTKIVLDSWEEIFTITNSSKDFAIGKTAFPKPQILGFFLEEIITQKIYKLYPSTWMPDPTGYSKDLVNIREPQFSIEIKTSSSPKNIYGNRSYGQSGESSKKSKDGYYLAINFEQFDKDNPLARRPEIRLIRFGYLNYTDWRSQNSSTGQQARIPANIENVKLLPIYRR
ncbi:ScaI family restriction endonuclease [Actinobacillus pleuropneumoniae]|uniref:ScaI family restriction endonuclease n=1 Tax=Actinobacillus pleuropneumoniae TaxID=715 RepID=UPI003CFEA988